MSPLETALAFGVALPSAVVLLLVTLATLTREEDR